MFARSLWLFFCLYTFRSMFARSLYFISVPIALLPWSLRLLHSLYRCSSLHGPFGYTFSPICAADCSMFSQSLQLYLWTWSNIPWCMKQYIIILTSICPDAQQHVFLFLSKQHSAVKSLLEWTLLWEGGPYGSVSAAKPFLLTKKVSLPNTIDSISASSLQ